jgi:hypothetical protein
MTEERWIVIPGWDKFQHRDAGRSGRGPIWIRDYTDQLNKDEYRALTYHQRGLLRDLRLSFALAQGQLGGSTQLLSRRLGATIKVRDLEALANAGFIVFSAGKPPALGQQTSRVDVDVDVDVEEDTKAVTSSEYVGNGPGFQILEDLLKDMP